jgi:hypothetical protein
MKKTLRVWLRDLPLEPIIYNNVTDTETVDGDLLIKSGATVIGVVKCSNVLFTEDVVDLNNPELYEHECV